MTTYVYGPTPDEVIIGGGGGGGGSATLPGITPVPPSGDTSGVTDTAAIHAARDLAAAGTIIQLQPGGTYTVTGLVMNKRQSWHAHGATIKLANASNQHMVNITAVGCRVRGGEWDGNRANQTSTGLWGIIANTVSDTILEEVYVHSVNGTCIASWDSDNSRMYRCRANDPTPGGTGIYANCQTANRSIIHITDCVVDRSSESTAVTGRGIKVDRSNASFTMSDIKITGLVKMPAANNAGAICVECWGGCQNVNIDVETEGGGMGVSCDGLDTGKVRFSSRGALQNGIEIATVAKHLSVTGTVDGQGVCGAGVQITNTTCEEVTLDVQVDNCYSRCIKAQNASNFTIKGTYRMRASGQNGMEIIGSSDLHFAAELDGRNDAGVATAQDGIDIDHSSSVTGFLKIAHFTRAAVGFYSFSVGFKVDNVSLWGSITDCGATPVQNFGFSSAADLGTNVRFHFDTDQFAPNVASAAALSLPWHTPAVKVTGTTGITSIPAAQTQKGREVTLIFTGALTVTSGSNLILNGNFTTAANSVLRLLSDGTNWYEVSRKP